MKCGLEISFTKAEWTFPAKKGNNILGYQVSNSSKLLVLAQCATCHKPFILTMRTLPVWGLFF